MSEYNEPWRIEDAYCGQWFEIVGADGKVVADDGSAASEYDQAMSKETARRIVACVNACKGLDTDLLEKLIGASVDGNPLRGLFDQLTLSGISAEATLDRVRAITVEEIRDAYQAWVRKPSGKSSPEYQFAKNDEEKGGVFFQALGFYGGFESFLRLLTERMDGSDGRYRKENK